MVEELLRKELHLDTETYGSRRDGLTDRQHLASDVAELRVLLGNAGYDRSEINAQLNELIRQNKALGGFENDYKDRSAFFFGGTSTNAER